MKTHPKIEQLKNAIADKLSPYLQKIKGKLQLIQLFYEKFFGVRVLSWVHFKYERKYMNQAPKIDILTRLALVARDAQPDEVAKKLFDTKPKNKYETVTLKKIDIVPIRSLPKI